MEKGGSKDKEEKRDKKKENVESQPNIHAPKPTPSPSEVLMDIIELIKMKYQCQSQWLALPIGDSMSGKRRRDGWVRIYSCEKEITEERERGGWGKRRKTQSECKREGKLI